MTGKKRRRKLMRKRRSKKVWLIPSVVAVLIILAAIVLWKAVGPGKGADGKGNDAAEQKAVEFPYSLEDGKIEVTSLFQYSGVNPDCNDESGEDIASLEIVNKSEQHLANAEFTVQLEDGTKIPFAVTDVPAGQTVWAYAADNSSYDMSAACTSIVCEAEFEDETALMEDKLTIEVQETAVTLTNISGEELTNLNVNCHCLFEEAYFGGLTYIYPVESIPAGESITLQAEECYLGEAAVVRVSQGD